MSSINITGREVGPGHPTYFIADISANHDGELERAKALIHLAAESGADAAKFQHFSAESIVSGRGFADLGAKVGHQAAWRESVVEVYRRASLPWEWTPVLREECRRAGIHFFSAAYDFGAVDMLEPYVPAYKIGSGDITWTQIIGYIASKGKPVLLATGASSMDDVRRAALAVLQANSQLLLMQCNTNYTGDIENLRSVNLNVLQTYALSFPGVPLGLSDHTPGHAAVLGAVALGATAIEKHFTDDTSREGPDHPFSMTPASWREMVDRTRELEVALGSGLKQVESNESETVVVQRRSLRAARALPRGTVLTAKDLVALRPAPADSIPPYDLDRVVGRTTRKPLSEGAHLRWTSLD